MSRLLSGLIYIRWEDYWRVPLVMVNGRFMILSTKKLSQNSKMMLVFPVTKSNLIIVFRCSDLHPDGHVYAMGCEDGTIHVYDFLTGQLSGTLGPRPGAV